MFKAPTGGTSLFGAARIDSPTPKRAARQRAEKRGRRTSHRTLEEPPQCAMPPLALGLASGVGGPPPLNISDEPTRTVRAMRPFECERVYRIKGNPPCPSLLDALIEPHQFRGRPPARPSGASLDLAPKLATLTRRTRCTESAVCVSKNSQIAQTEPAAVFSVFRNQQFVRPAHRRNRAVRCAVQKRRPIQRSAREIRDGSHSLPHDRKENGLQRRTFLLFARPVWRDRLSDQSASCEDAPRE